jgi:hypothetical protein
METGCVFSAVGTGILFCLCNFDELPSTSSVKERHANGSFMIPVTLTASLQATVKEKTRITCWNIFVLRKIT